MVTAWVGFVSLGILLARHFKGTWQDSTLGGVKVWFAVSFNFSFPYSELHFQNFAVVIRA